MLASSHHKPLLVATMALQKGTTTAAAVGSVQTRQLSWCLDVQRPHNPRDLYYGIYGVYIGILACRGLSLVSSPLHAMKSQSQIQSSAAVNLGVTDIQEKDKIKAKNDKTEHENGKSVKQKSKSKPKVKFKLKSKSTPRSSIGKSIRKRTRVNGT
ncbi:hypothetical protein Tco_0619806, partial [Tanacetum coccineum]